MKVVKDNSKQLEAAIKTLSETRVLVGVPDTANSRSGQIGNAALAYIHEHGAPEANIPARPFMRPGVASIKGVLENTFKRAGEVALRSRPEMVLREFEKIGIMAQSAIKNMIVAGLSPPLKYETVLARIRRRKSETYRGEKRAAVRANVARGAAPGEGLFRPLIDTGQLLQSITYVVRKRG